MLATPLGVARRASSATCCASRSGCCIGVGDLPRRDGAVRRRRVAAGAARRARPPCSPAWRSPRRSSRFAASTRERRRLRRAVPVRGHRRCSCSRARSSRSSQLPAGLELARVRHAAVARRRAVPRPRASAPADAGGARRCHVAYLAAWIGGRRLARRARPSAGGWSSDGEPPATDRRRWPPAILPAAARPAAGPGCSSSATCWSTGAIWLIIVSGFFEPVFYLLVDRRRDRRARRRRRRAGRPGRSTTPPSSRPALLASSAMNGAIYDSTMNVFFKLKYAKTYDAMLATPLGRARRRARRDHLGAAPRRALLGRVPAS